MKITFFDGSFSLSWDKCRAWFNADGTLKDCEYKRRDHKGYMTARAIPMKHHRVRAWLARQGAHEVKAPYHAGHVGHAKTEFEQRLAAKGLPIPQTA